MVRLSDLLEDNVNMPPRLGLYIFSLVASQCLEETEVENKYLEGLCPERLLLNDDWYDDLTEVTIAPAKHIPQAFAYYPPEYLNGHIWDKTCTSFALFAISYRVLTGELPYLGNIPEELLSSEEGKRYINRKRKDFFWVDVAHIPASFRGFYAKGLSLRRKDRYKAIGDTCEEFFLLAHYINQSDFENSNVCDNSDVSTSLDFYKDISQNSSAVFTLNVQTPGKGGFDDLVGLNDLKKYVRNNVLAVLRNPEKAKKYNISLPNGLLLYGPPGCGKTAFARAVAEEAKMAYAIVNAQDIASTFVHGTQSMVKQMFKQAESFAPIILILDEIETMVPNRNNPDNVKIAEDTNAFLSELNDCGKRGIFVIATTNRPQFMDSACLRSGRFDKRVYVPLPDEQVRTEIFHAYLKNRPIDNHIDYSALSKLTSSGYISSDIRQICNDVAIKAFNDDTIITQGLIEEVIQDGGPSVSKYELRTYEEARKYMEPETKYAHNINKIGFR